MFFLLGKGIKIYLFHRLKIIAVWEGVLESRCGGCLISIFDREWWIGSLV
ncbi:MAG: hypothetical protein ACI89U_001786 [Gammaproteobacteria bacterium]|jgi:hypothetical protein